jgi:hypothetical protein
MRRLIVVSAALGLGACIVIPIPIPTVHAEFAAAAGVRAALLRIRKDIPKIEGNLRPLRCGGGKCYSSAEVQAALETVRARVRAAMPPEAKPLQLALEEDLDNAMKLGQPMLLDTIQPAQLRADAAPSGYGTGQVHGIFGSIGAALDRLLAHKDLAPNLSFRSQPRGAAVYIQVSNNGDTRRDVTTDNQLEHVWRAKYHGRAQKAGYRDTDVTLDLMSSSGTRVLCTMAAVGAAPTQQSSCGFER